MHSIVGIIYKSICSSAQTGTETDAPFLDTAIADACAAIESHNNPWISIAETVIGRGSRAFEVYRKTCPAYLEDISDIHRTEPYVYAQMVAGADAPRHGEAKNSWLTGTAAWTYK